MISKLTRRNVIAAAAATGTAMLMQAGKLGRLQAARGEAPFPATGSMPRASGDSWPPGEPGRDYVPVVTPNGVTLPYRIVDGVKVMHLIAQPVEHEFAPGLRAHCWGYNGRTPGPTIEAVAGDRLRIYVSNRLPEATTVHWHGIRVPCGMDGVNGLTQQPIPPGETFRYEFTVPEAGTFMYHPHFDEMTQQALGMMGMFVVHARQPRGARCDRDYALMLSEWRLDPGASRPNPTEMTDFNVLTINSKCYPGTAPLIAQKGERIRIRFGNLSAMDHHPMHLHGFQMMLTETDGGQLPASAQYPANTILVPVGSTRAAEIIADNPGDWALHCHMSHHTMNQMGHATPTLLGVTGGKWKKEAQSVLPGLMEMGESGMSDMGDMGMPVPANSIPMKGGQGQFGPIDMGGMFTVLKVREKLAGDGDPGNYSFPPGTVAAAATEEEMRKDGIEGKDEG